MQDRLRDLGIWRKEVKLSAFELPPCRGTCILTSSSTELKVRKKA